MNLEKLKELDKAASAGPWGYSTCYGVATIEDSSREGIAHAVEYLKRPDAELIAAMRNALPKLIKVAEAAQGVYDSGTIDGAVGFIPACTKLVEALEELEK